MHKTQTAISLSWQLEDIDFSRIDRDLLRDRDDLFLLVCSASFLESTSDTFAGNLAAYFVDDAEVHKWLAESWEPEELQHGRALMTYVKHVWSNFDWDSAYADFFAEYSRLCTTDELEPTRGQEMAARCVVEMGTTTYYQAVHALCNEPVLRDLTWRIRADEVQHYRHFYHYFLKYRQQENLNRLRVLALLLRRVADLRRSDAEIALRHAGSAHFRGRIPPASVSGAIKRLFAEFSAEYPIELAVRMVLKPLQLNARLQRWAERPLIALAQSLLLN
jgi:hypothetical protein